MDYTVHGILQARILDWVAILFSRGSSQPGIEPRSPALQAGSLPSEPQGSFTIRGQQRPNFWTFAGEAGVSGLGVLGCGPWQPCSLTCLALPSLIFSPWIHFWASECFCRQGPPFPSENEKMTNTLQSFPESQEKSIIFQDPHVPLSVDQKLIRAAVSASPTSSRVLHLGDAKFTTSITP